MVGAAYIGLGASAGEVPAPLDKIPPGQAWEDFCALISAYYEETQGFTARRAMFSKADAGDYDQLARFGEWDVTTDPDRREVR